MTKQPDTALWRASMQTARDIGRGLFTTTSQKRVMHGDLHHDNVILTEDGPRAFDAKGVVGDPAYELANVFRDHKGVGDELLQPARIHSLAALASEALDVPATRMLHWEIANAAWSIAITTDRPLTQSGDAPILAALLIASDEIPETSRIT